VDPKKIKIGRRINPTPSKPRVSDAEIRKALSGIASSSSSATSSSQSASTYLGQVMRLFYTRWNPPATATAASGSTLVRIYMNKQTGQILKSVKIKGSGDSVYDKTVMLAVETVRTLPKPPADYAFDYVEIIFTLDH
jgi:TonB family protein